MYTERWEAMVLVLWTYSSAGVFVPIQGMMIYIPLGYFSAVV